MTRSKPHLLLGLVLSGALLGGCEQLGIPDFTKSSAKAEADGKAIGSACRHAGRAIEDCYTLNKKADRPAVYAGWREMNEYMRENKIEPVIPVIKPEPPVAAKPAANPDEADEAVEPAPKKVAASKH